MGRTSRRPSYLDWQGDGETDHIGIATSAPYGTKTDTVEGNTSWGYSVRRVMVEKPPQQQRDMDDG